MSFKGEGVMQRVARASALSRSSAVTRCGSNGEACKALCMGSVTRRVAPRTALAPMCGISPDFLCAFPQFARGFCPSPAFPMSAAFLFASENPFFTEGMVSKPQPCKAALARGLHKHMHKEIRNGRGLLRGVTQAVPARCKPPTCHRQNVGGISLASPHRMQHTS